MSIHRNTGHLGRIGAPVLHVPTAVIVAGLATVGVLATVYLLVAVSIAQPTVTTEPSVVPEAVVVAPAPVPEVAAPAAILGAVTHVQTNVPDVDSQDFILQQAGLAPVTQRSVTAAAPPLARASAPVVAVDKSTSTPGRVEIGMAEVDTQAYILAQAGPALRSDLPPAAH